jgi:hypothetical protein
VPAADRDLHGAAHGLLALDFGKVGDMRGGTRLVVSLGERRISERAQFQVARDEARGLVQRVHLENVDPFHERGLVRRHRRHDDAALSCLPRHDGHREAAFDGSDRTGEAELARDDEIVEAFGADLPIGEQCRERDGQIVERAFLADAAWREVDRDARVGELESRVADRGVDAVLGFLDRGVGQPDEEELGLAALLRVNLDLYGHGVDPEQRC